METRASYVAVGLSWSCCSPLSLSPRIWFVRGQLAENTTRYETYFASVGSGLSAGSPVRVNGVQLGRVAEVELDPDNPTRVRVTMDIVQRRTHPLELGRLARDPEPCRHDGDRDQRRHQGRAADRKSSPIRAIR